MGSFCRSSPQTTTQQQTQTYTPAPQIMGAGTQALTAAQQAAAQPFQMPAAPVAGFSPLQTQYFNDISNMQGMAQPYFATGQQYLQGSAAPITGADVSAYYNPMAGNVMAGLQDVFGQQMRQMTGSATQQAGGAGADRIAVAQAELARQQGLTAGQVEASLWQQALTGAEQQKQMMAGAGYGIAQMGPAAQAAALQGYSALGTAGGLQQQLTQAQQNALYQQQLAQIAYPFQTPQYLAGITGALAPGMGGITSGAGTSTLTPAQPSMLAQIMGGLTAGTGLAGSAGLFGGGTSAGTGTMGTGGTGLSLTGTGGLYDRGGKVIDLDASEYQEGGGAFDPTEQAGPQGQSPFSMAQETMPNMSVMGAPMPSGRPMSIKAEPIPTTPLMRDPRLPSQVGAMQMNMPQQQQQKAADSGIGDVVKFAANIIPFFLKRGGKIELDALGGAVGPMDVGRGFATDDEIDATDLPPISYTPTPMEQRVADRNADALIGREASGTPTDAVVPPVGGPPMAIASPVPTTGGPRSIALPPSMTSQAQYRAPMGANADLNVDTFTMPQSQLPYPDATKRDWGQDLTRSPWMSLVAAGARMMQTPGPIGSVIGAGLGAGAQELGAQRKELRSEQDINEKAQQLHQQAQQYALEWTRTKPMSEYERAEAAKPVVVGQKIGPMGQVIPVYGQRMPDGTYIDPVTRKPFDPSTLIGGTSTQEDVGGTPEEVLKTLPPQMRNTVKGLISGDIDISKVGYRDRTALMNAATQVDPSFNTYTAPLRAQTIKNYTGTGVEARNFTSNDMAIKHIGSGLGNIEAMQNLTYTPALNVPYNVWRREVSPQFQAAQSGLKTDIDAIGSELMRSFRGSGSASEREATEWRSNFPINGSPVEQRRAFQEAANLLAGRITAAGVRYNDAMGPLHARDPLSWLSKEGRNIINYTTTQLDPQKPIPSNFKDIISGSVSTPSTGAAPKVGETRTNAHGVTGTWNGNAWVVQ